MKHLQENFVFLLFVLLFSSCTGNQCLFTQKGVCTQQAAGIDDLDPNQNGPRLSSTQIFETTLHQILSNSSCLNCHAGNGPGSGSFVAEDIETAHEAALQVVDLDDPDFSRIPEKVESGHNCGEGVDCSDLADELLNSIREWSEKLAQQNAIIENNNSDDNNNSNNDDSSSASGNNFNNDNSSSGSANTNTNTNNGGSGSNSNSGNEANQRFLAAQSVLNANCTSCHTNGSGASVLNFTNSFSENDYTNLGNRILLEGDANSSVLYQRMNSSTNGSNAPMPLSGYLNPSETIKIKNWIDGL